MKKIFLLSLILVLINLPVFAAYGVNSKNVELRLKMEKNNYALIVGVAEYPPPIKSLEFTERDARRFADVLIANGWDKDKVKVLVGKDALYHNILSKLDVITAGNSTPSPGSTVMFFYSGHGMQDDNGETYIVPYDGTFETDPEKVKNRNIKVKDIENMVQGSSYSYKYIFLDACRGEKVPGSMGGNKGINYKGINGSSDMRVFLSTRQGEISIEDQSLDSDKGSGVFSFYLIDGLGGNADANKNGIIEEKELSDYVSDGMKEYSLNHQKQSMVTRGECEPDAPIVVINDPGKKRLITGVEIKMKGQQTGYTYIPDPQYIDVEIHGDAQAVDSVYSSQITATLNVGGCYQGSNTFNIPDQSFLQFGLPMGISIVSLKQSSIKVEVIGGYNQVPLYSEIRTLSGHSAAVMSVAFSPDGSKLASGSNGKTIKIWSVSDGREIRTLSEPNGFYCSSVAFSPDGSKLASGSFDDTIKIWSVSDGHEIRTLRGHSGPVLSGVFSPDGSKLASGSGSIEGEPSNPTIKGEIKIWSLDDGREIRTLSGHSNWISSVAFSPDGSMLASGSYDNTIKLWRVK